jgi:diadenylate cyclase
LPAAGRGAFFAGPTSFALSLPFPFYFLHVGLADVADVLLVTWLLYQLYKLLRGSVALNVALGLLSLYLVYLVVNALGLGLLSAILGEFMSVGVLASIILFQQEIRRFLLNVGKAALEGGGPLGWWRRPSGTPSGTPSVAAFVEAATSLASKETGASMPSPASACCWPFSTKLRPCTTVPCWWPKAAWWPPAASCP